MKDELQAWPFTLVPLKEGGQKWECGEEKMGRRGRYGRVEGQGTAAWGCLLSCFPRRSCYRPL